MKKIILIVAAFITIYSGRMQAQKGFQIGGQATPHFSMLLNTDDDGNSDFKYLPTLTGSLGLTSQYGFMKNHGIGLDVVYSFQGQRYSLNNFERFKRVDYVKIPLMYVYTYDFNDNVMMIGKIGPQIGMLTNAKLTDKDGNDIRSDQKSLYMNTTFGGVAAWGIGIKLMYNFYFSALLRYDYNFAGSDENNSYNGHINKPNGGLPPSNRADTHNTTAGVTFGITYLCKSMK